MINHDRQLRSTDAKLLSEELDIHAEFTLVNDTLSSYLDR